MTTGVSSTSSSAADVLASLNSKNTTSTSQASEQQSKFLTLLTTQLKNQDPLNPMDNSQMTSQLAQISTVDGIEKLNTTLKTMLESSQASETLQAAALLGRGVLVPGTGLQLASGAAVGGVELAEAADSVKAIVSDKSGNQVASIDLGALDAGTHNFQWDGKTTSGNAAADGSYTVSFVATRGNTSVSTTTLELGVVGSVVRTSSGVNIDLGSVGTFGMSDVRQIL